MLLFELDNAGVQYNGSPALSGVTLKIHRGEKIAIVGPNGAGKSSLLGLLYDQHKEETSLLPQELGLVKTLSVFHNIFMARLNRHSVWYNLSNLAFPKKKEVEAIREVVQRLRFEDKLFTPAGELSGGQQQRTAVGRALYQHSRILLGDEPLSAIDEKQAGVVLDCLVKEHETVVLALHDVDMALSFADRIIGVKAGRIVMDQPTSGMTRSDLDDVFHH
ncbi:MAG: hypothetical protein A3G18_09520 [Rhodospirillales bacterium RIFCSPLOWO2_12_FULL_58_28]|nr:MAG: hypothetical protein A3H92_02150 [Rhodospirillales bacterium RIFCSPLOWO2_02_FULL_58_16]OHC76741.1 MAG: hypothetical protein A3G18_09520 [Rhodospirillales bacterium RIFCSPLOWO2_12_FULL_58_28]